LDIALAPNASWKLVLRPPQWTVSRILFPPARRPFGRRLRRTTIIPLAPPSLAGSSGLPGSFERAVLVALPYLALLRAGFSLPPVLPRARCALTAPFHPYPSTRALSRARSGRCIFCATFLRVAPTGRYPAHCPAEFGLSFRLRALRALRRDRPARSCGPASSKRPKDAKTGDRLVHCGGDIECW